MSMSVSSSEEGGGGLRAHLSKSACFDFARLIAERLMTSSTCLGVYIVMIALNLWILMWEFTGGKSHWLVLATETIINFLLIVEVIVNTISIENYFSSPLNVVDFIITLTCLVFFVMFLVEESKGDDDLTLIDMTVLSLRYAFQMLRLLFLLYRGRKVRLLTQSNDIQFIQLASNAHDENDAFPLTSFQFLAQRGDMLSHLRDQREWSESSPSQTHVHPPAPAFAASSLVRTGSEPQTPSPSSAPISSFSKRLTEINFALDASPSTILEYHTQPSPLSWSGRSSQASSFINNDDDDNDNEDEATHRFTQAALA